MKPWTAWWVRLGLAGSCLIATGCGGGGDVPDPESDSRAASASAPAAAPPPAPPAADEPAPPAAAPPAGDEEPKVASTPPGDKPPGDAEVKDAPAPADEASGGKSDSATNEMLALANGPAAPADNIPDKTEGTDPSSPTNPGGAGMPGMPGAPGSSAGMTIGPRGGPGGRGGPPGMGGGMAADDGGARPPGSLGGAGGPLGGGGGGANLPPADYRSPLGGVNAFLAALKAKDAAALAEATALRASREAATDSNKKLFESIISGEITPERLDELAQKLDGYQVSGMNQQKSTARLGITLTKRDGNDMLRRTITVRKEAAGWKVCDIGGEGEMQGGTRLRRRR